MNISMNFFRAIGICPQLVFDSMPVPNSSRKVVVIVSLVLFFGDAIYCFMPSNNFKFSATFLRNGLTLKRQPFVYSLKSVKELQDSEES